MPPLTDEITIHVLDHGYVRYVDHMGTDQRIVESARVSYHSASKGPEKDRQLLFYLWKNRHTSPFEMGKITLNVKMPIFVMRQWVRHRMQNLNEVSARYTELPGEFYIPKAWRLQDEKNKQGSIGSDDWNPTIHECSDHHISATHALEEHCRVAYEIYESMIKAGIAREMARFILPVNIYTEIYCTWDLKNLMHFLELRLDEHAQWEIRQYANAVKTITQRFFPWTIEAFDRFKFKLQDMRYDTTAPTS